MGRHLCLHLAMGTMDDRELGEAVADRDWYHTIELRPGLVTPGWFDTRAVADRVPFPPVAGLRCLDVGTFDGFWAFEMERRGAGEVIAIDVPDPAAWDWPPAAPPEVRARVGARHQGGGGFEIARAALGSEVRRERISVYDVAPDRVGTFDLVYVGSLLLHLRDPVGALDRLRRVCHGQLVLVDAIDGWLTMRSPRRPLAALDGRQRPWWWKPNQAALVRMVEAAGFELAGPVQRLRIPPGAGQPTAPLRPRVLLARAGREALVSSRWGDLHAAVRARPLTTPG